MDALEDSHVVGEAGRVRGRRVAGWIELAPALGFACGAVALLLVTRVEWAATGDELRSNVTTALITLASLAVWGLASERRTPPLFASAWRAPTARNAIPMERVSFVRRGRGFAVAFAITIAAGIGGPAIWDDGTTGGVIVYAAGFGALQLAPWLIIRALEVHRGAHVIEVFDPEDKETTVVVFAAPDHTTTAMAAFGR